MARGGVFLYFINKDKRVIVVADNARDAKKLFSGARFGSACGLRRISSRNVVVEVGRSAGYEVIIHVSRFALRVAQYEEGGE